MAGWVYIISNKAMPNILKIGYTERTPYIRAYELYNTGCPYPYKVDYAIYVDRPYEVEQKAHELQRANNVGKEWFSCSFEEAVSTINKAINLLGAKIEPDKKPEAPTPDDIRGIIANNPDAAVIIEQPKINVDAEIDRIKSEYQNKRKELERKELDAADSFKMILSWFFLQIIGVYILYLLFGDKLIIREGILSTTIFLIIGGFILVYPIMFIILFITMICPFLENWYDRLLCLLNKICRYKSILKYRSNMSLLYSEEKFQLEKLNKAK